MHLYFLKAVFIAILLSTVSPILSAKEANACLDDAYNPPAYPKCPVGCGDVADAIIVRSDSLWWRACEEEIALGDLEEVSDWMVSPGRSFVRDVAHLKQMQFHYEPGFRIGLERVCACDCWGLVLNWTHFHSKATAHVGNVDLLGNPETVFISFWERGTDLFPLAARSSWKLGIDLLDLEMGNQYYVSSCIALKPFFGLRGTRITQTYLTEAIANGNTDIGESDSFISRTKSRANFTALGPRVGLRMQFDVVCGWSIVGEAAASLVFGRSERHSKEHNTEFASVEEAQNLVNFEYQTKHGLEHSSKTITDLTLGLHWNRCVEFCRRLHVVQVLIAWEHHLFGNLNTFDFASQGIAIRSGTLTGSTSKKFGDLSVQGLTASVQIGF